MILSLKVNIYIPIRLNFLPFLPPQNLVYSSVMKNKKKNKKQKKNANKKINMLVKERK
jgi:hypothetical protein